MIALPSPRTRKKSSARTVHTFSSNCFLHFNNWIQHVLSSNIVPKINNLYYKSLQKQLLSGKRPDLIVNICNINTIIKLNKLTCDKLCHSGKKANYMKQQLEDFFIIGESDIFFNCVLTIPDFQWEICSNIAYNAYHNYKKIHKCIWTYLIYVSNCTNV